MTDPTQETKKKPWWHTLPLIVGGLIGFAVAKVAVESAFKQFNKPSKAQVENALDQYANSAEGGALLKELQRSFPDDYSTMKSAMAGFALSGAAREEVQQKSAQTTKAFMRSHVQYAVKAPTKYLLALGRANASFINSMKVDSLQACADYGIKGVVSPKFLSPRSMNLLSQLGAAQVRAAREGMDNPVSHDEALSDNESEKFYAILKGQNLSDEVITAVGSGKGLEKLTVEEQCAAGSAILNGIATLPAETSVKLVISMLKDGA